MTSRTKAQNALAHFWLTNISGSEKEQSPSSVREAKPFAAPSWLKPQTSKVRSSARRNLFAINIAGQSQRHIFHHRSIGKIPVVRTVIWGLTLAPVLFVIGAAIQINQLARLWRGNAHAPRTRRNPDALDV